MRDRSLSLRACLGTPLVFRLFYFLIGAERMRLALTREHMRAQAGQAVLDIGCGTADVLEFLPVGIHYTGFDASSAYIAAAQARHGNRGTFLRLTLEEVEPGRFRDFHLVLAVGVLHHLSDPEAVRLCRLAYDALLPGGRFITLDGCFVEGQSPVARAILSRDRGAFVRREQDYARLASTAFSHVQARVRHDLLRIPYTHVIMECQKS